MRWLLLFTLLALLSIIHAQEVELAVQTGHSASITKIIYSADDRFIASAGNDNKIVLWDFATGKQYNVFLGHTAKVTDLSFSSDSKMLYSSSLDSTLRIWDIYSAVCQKTVKFNYPVGCIYLNEEENLLYGGGKYFFSYQLNDGKISNYEFKAEKLFTAIAYNTADSYLSIGGEKEDFAYIIDMKKGQLIRKFVAPVKTLKFDQSNSSLFYSTTDGKLIEYDLKAKKNKVKTSDWMLNAINSFDFNSTTVFYGNNKGEIRALDRENKWLQNGLYKSEKGRIQSISLSNDGKYLATAGDNRAIVIWNIVTGKVAKVLKGQVNRINDIAFSADGSEILVGYANGTVRKTNLISNQTIVNSIRPKSEIVNSISQYTVVRIESFTEENAVFTMLYQINSLVYEGSFDKIQEYKVVWDFKENVLEVEKVEEQNDKIKAYIKDLKKGVFHDNHYFLDTSLVESRNDSIGIYVRAENNELVACWTKDNKVCYKKALQHSDLVTSVAINPRYAYVATASWDGMIRFWDLKTGKLLTVYGAFGNGQFVYLNESGYYFTSKDALDYIGFKLQNRIYSFEQFDLKYNRPDIVAQSLPYFNEEYIAAYYGAYKKRLSKLGIDEDDIGISDNLPSIGITKSLLTGEILDSLDLKIQCTDQNNKLDKLHLNINGVPEFSRFGKQLKGNNQLVERTVILNPGVNYIQIYVTNDKGVSSYKETFKVVSHKKKKSANLYLITVGVSKYQQTQYNLNYARKDAEDIAFYFTHFNFYFGDIKSKSLLDEEVTVENIAQLHDFIADANENDVVILFAAGHGVLDVNLDYYFASYNMDFSHPEEKGIPYELFEELMDKTTSRKKVMFLDACHSGEIDKDEVVENLVAEEENGELIFRGALRSISNKYDINSFDLSKSLFADMRLNNGSTVVSSAGGAEFAIEGDLWKNGVFTYAFLQGLRDRKADLNGDRIIMLSELQSYIQFEVNKITNGLQTPTSRAENLNNDFRIQ